MADLPLKYTPKTLRDYQRLMDRYEEVNDNYLLPDLRLIIRIDAHRFGDSWAELNDYDYPYHKEILDALIATARRLMALELRVNFAFIHGDEISLLFDRVENGGLRRRAKFLTHLASAGSLFFTEEYKRPVFFRAKLSELPSDARVVDYFFWQRKVALRNFFSRAFGFILSGQGMSSQAIAKKLGKLTEEDLWTTARELDIPIERIPRYFLYGTGLWWEEMAKGYRIAVGESLPKEDDVFYKLLKDTVAGVSHVPDRAGSPVQWHEVSYEPPRAENPTKPKVQSEEASVADSPGGFRVFGVKGARIIPK